MFISCFAVTLYSVKRFSYLGKLCVDEPRDERGLADGAVADEHDGASVARVPPHAAHHTGGDQSHSNPLCVLHAALTGYFNFESL